MIRFGEVFKSLRIEKNKSQKDLALVFHVSQAAVSNWEAGRKLPEVPMLVEISRYFEVSLDYLLGLEN